MKANVYVTLKTEVLDPQGDAVRRGLDALGMKGVKNVRIGKLVEIELDAADKATAERELKSMAEKLLANAVIEDFRIEVVG
jgi:phosphoribosylformylglycinamidine synthase